MNTNTPRTSRSFEYGEPTRHSFGIYDTRGRVFGALTRIDVVTYTLADDETNSWHEHAAGVWYRVDTHVTRNGSAYGASHRGHEFTTREAAEAFAAQYLVEAAKRAAKHRDRAPVAA